MGDPVEYLSELQRNPLGRQLMKQMTGAQLLTMTGSQLLTALIKVGDKGNNNLTEEKQWECHAKKPSTAQEEPLRINKP